MRTYRECPSCRALLTSGQIASGRGECPYCGARLASDTDMPAGWERDDENPYAPPGPALAPQNAPEATIPAGFGGKLVMAFRLLFGQLPLFAALVLTVWIPGHALIDLALAGNPNQADPLKMLQLGQLVEMVFGPIYTAAIITTLAARMAGARLSYLEAMRAGLHHWGRLFLARLMSGLLVLVGIIAFIVPGILLAIRFMFLDEAVVLEGAGAAAARRRSAQLTFGRGLRLVAVFVVSMGLIMAFSLLLAKLVELAGLINVFPVAEVCDCLISVFAVFFHCLVFLYYWEACQQEQNADADSLSGNELQV